MADQEQERQTAQPGAASTTTSTAASPETAMHETRMKVTRQRRAMRKGAPGRTPQVDIPEGGGAPLSAPVKRSMEKKLGADLSDVKVHTGGASAGAAEQLNARAFTVGSDVHFNGGQYDPSTKDGTELLAHELTHVVQAQKSAVQRKEEDTVEADAAGKDGEALEVSDPDEPAEREADSVAKEATEAMGTGGAAADGNDANLSDADAANQAAPASEGDGSVAHEQAPEAGAKLATPISRRIDASALRKLLRKKALRDEQSQDDDASAPDAGEGEPARSTDAPDNGAAQLTDESVQSESDESEPSMSVAAKLRGVHRKVFRAATAPTAPAPDADVDTATIKSELAAGANAAGNNYTADEATGLADKIAASGKMKRSALDVAKVGCEKKLLTEWKAKSTDHAEFLKGFARPDPIAVRKFSELDGEPDSNYENDAGSACRSIFYARLASDVLANPGSRTNVFARCNDAVRDGGLRMKGKLIPESILEPTLHRTAGLNGTFDYTTNRQAVAADLFADPKYKTKLAPEIQRIGHNTALELYPELIREYWIDRGGDYAKAKLKGPLTPPKGGTWFSSGAVKVQPGDAGFSELMEIGALQPEWFAEGCVKFTVASAGLGTVKENLRKPTCLDGMQSGMFVPRPDGVFGVTGGGFNEFLAANVPSENVVSMELLKSSAGLEAAIRAANTAAKAAGHSSTMDGMERGNKANLGSAQATYDRVGARTEQERKAPTPMDERGQRI